ncbi:hypothetical protein B0H34DRAFT_693732 [Crassisporium funariophilum]|nr:hypothetical protein B0H34DRAFT_693732 [Crassisporium funariophilum]
MSSTFTPSTTIDMTKERDWPANLGMLDWDSTSIVFTKRTLIEFLKYTGTTVDPNFTNIGKLPRYAKFGKLTAPSTEIEDSLTESETNSAAAADAFKPTRRVRTVPGGPHTDIFAQGDEGDALSHAPPKPVDAEISTPSVPTPLQTEPDQEEDVGGINFTSSVKPSRRVRENPGGNASMSNFWDPETPTEFKPTRRVRQGPGGHDSISGIF